MPVEDESDGHMLKYFTESESRIIEQKWMNIFCKDKQGVNTKDYKWHIFSGGRYPSIEGKAAQEAYDTHRCATYMVMHNNEYSVRLTRSKPIDVNRQDVFVFPENMAWTMAFTHEGGWLGPYFAKHPQYEQLEKENRAYGEKLKQIEYAKSKGWLK
ncbi:hypothetical protein TDB9533_03899 [Thalassocella blandensis]|nr:hypothetical protein TDB9533_03899 [Thalassocella blandensis]